MGGKTGKPTLANLVKKADRVQSDARAGKQRLDDIGTKLEGVKRKLSDLKQDREGRR